MSEFINPGLVALNFLLIIPWIGLILTSKGSFPYFFTFLVLSMTIFVFYYYPNDIYQTVNKNISHFEKNGVLVCSDFIGSSRYKVSKELGWKLNYNKYNVAKEDKNNITTLHLQQCKPKEEL